MKIFIRILFISSTIFFISCNWGHKESEKISIDTDVNPNKVDSSKIMHNEMLDKSKTGVGPIKNKVELGAQIDQTMAKKGKDLFNNKCTVCHQIHESAVGPALGGVLEERSPQWVMNMILNPDGMIENNRQVQAMKAVYEARMVDLDLSEEQAREIVEYLRNY